MIVRHALALASVAFLIGCHGDASWRQTGADAGWGAETNARAEAAGDRGPAADTHAAVPDTSARGVDAQPASTTPVTTDSSMPDGLGVEVYRAPDAASTIDSGSPDRAVDAGAGVDLAADLRAASDGAADVGAGADLAIADAAPDATDADGEGPEGGGGR